MLFFATQFYNPLSFAGMRRALHTLQYLIVYIHLKKCILSDRVLIYFAKKVKRQEWQIEEVKYLGVVLQCIVGQEAQISSPY